jgi:hypothetical protein
VAGETFDDLSGPDASVHLVGGVDVDGGAVSQDVAQPCVLDQAVDGGERVRGDEGAQPLDDVSVVIVMRGLDQGDLEAARDRWRMHQQQSLLRRNGTGGSSLLLNRVVLGKRLRVTREVGAVACGPPPESPN